ncbi:MAG: LuxR C-terminal-related transcriptional regulator [Actinomycetota bacterium]
MPETAGRGKMNQGLADDRRSATLRRRLCGRDAEIATIERSLDDARSGGGAGIVAVIGDSGFGKSALLEHAAARADDMRVLRCVGAPAEAALAFAGLLQMVRPLLGLISGLPGPQAAAISSVFGLSEDRVEDRFLISVAVLSLLSEAAEEVPLACIIDEVGFLDHESVDTLAFVARRLDAEPIAFLVGLTGEEAQRFEVPKSVRIRLSPLGEEDALALVRDAAPVNVSTTVAYRIVGAAAGVPLLLVELVASLTPDQLEGRIPLPIALPLSPVVEELCLGRVRALPEASRTALLVAAATRQGSLNSIADVLRVLGLEEDALDDAARAGLVHVADRVSFSHPAVRLAVYANASSADRRCVHDALASVHADRGDEDLRVWHRALATIGPDEDVAGELERSAERAAARSGCAAAASALERAAELSVDLPGRAGRLARAAEMAWLGGQPDYAMALAAEAEANDGDAKTQARVDFVRAAWETQRGVTGDAVPILLHAAHAVEDLDPDMALRILLGAMMVISLTGRHAPPAELDCLEQLVHRAAPGADHGLVSVVRVNEWMADGATRPPPRIPDDLSSLIERLDDPVLAPFAIPTAAYLGDLGTARINGERAVRDARARGALGMLSFGLRQLAALDIWAHRFDDALIHAAEGLRLGVETGNENVALVHHALLAVVAAVRGEEERCRDEADTALLGAIERSNRDAVDWANLALGHLELALGRPEACDRFETMWQPAGIPQLRLVSAADAVEAALHAERREMAQSCLDDLERWTSHTRAPWSLPLVERCHALLAEGTEAERRFEEALLLHQVTSSAFDRARTQLLYGEFLRRARRRAEARPHLRAAVETFASVHAALWEERARNELRATGEVVRRRGPAAIWQLTPQELQIARIVARGASNRDAAAELFLSPRTIEYHLRKVFTKLGISSRVELVRMRLDGGP